MNASLEIIQRIGQKLQLLVKQRDGLQRDKERLQDELGKKQEQIAQLKDQLSQMEEQLSIMKSATIQMDDKSKKEFEKRINGYIKDIDKVIGHLQT
jgi:chromosome segregation ATPase